ncbi:hypothetical protein [Caballeronia arvi]|uniref:hypothetical protein n=1 Tax=Caballeronia arvi TaxID=1777135 RepID=UPI00077250D3|nr:hypothetical protein [Caballeronia arvi]
MNWLWTWSGNSFGYRVDDQLRTHDGRHVGRFVGEEIYGADGLYLGELASEDRLITRQRKLGRFRLPFRPRMKQVERVQRTARAARLIRPGCQDFPAPSYL